MNDPKKSIVKLVLLILLLPFSINVMAENILKVTSVSVIEGNNSSIEIQVINSEVLVGFQFDLTLPDAITVNTNMMTLSGRKQDHLLIVSSLGSNVFRFISYSPSQSPYLLNSGNIVTIPFFAKAGFVGNHSITITNSILGNSSSENILTGTQNGTLTIQSLNIAPIANAGADQTVKEGTTVSLDGSLSSDPDGNPLTYKWTAPAGITLNSTTVTKPTFSAPSVSKDTQFSIKLVVNNGIVNSNTDEVIITVKNVNGSEDILESEIGVFPNPVKEGFYITGLVEKSKIEMKDMSGRTLISREITPGAFIPTEELLQGFYLLKIETKMGLVIRKIIKE